MRTHATSARTARRRVEAQGFTGLPDETVAGLDLALRLSPAICMTWAASGTALASPAALWALVPFALLGAILPGHPFDVLYNHLLRHRLGRESIPRYPRPRRFACLLASLFLMAAGGAFRAGQPAIGYAFGGSLTLAAFVNVSAGFCIPSFLYGMVFGQPRCPAPRGEKEILQ